MRILIQGNPVIRNDERGLLSRFGLEYRPDRKLDFERVALARS